MRDCRKYKNNPITLVILKITFPQILSLSQTDPPSEFQKRIMSNFPFIKTHKGLDVSVQLNKNDGIVDRKENIGWEFHSRNEKQKVFVNDENVIFEFRDYNSFEEFFEIVKEIFDDFMEIYNLGIFEIGLRYINEIEHSGDPREWKGLINENLISPSETFINSEDILMRSMHSLELKDDDYKFKFQFGLFNSEYPNPLTRKEFVLDYDCVSLDYVEQNDLYPTIKHFHKIIYDWFERSIEDPLRKTWGCYNE